MHTRKLGNSDLNITPVGFGAWAIGGTGYDFGWGPQDLRPQTLAPSARGSRNETASRSCLAR
jgi:aryl-alcohol dehydrogenase-like predicted oxidoreductase